MKKRYYIANMFWKQEELTFRENERVREILKGKFSMKEFTTDNIGELIERLYEGGVLKELIPVIMKRNDSGLRRFWNIAAHAITRTDSSTLIECMTDSEIARVMLDFFVFKTLWLQRLLNITIGSGSNLSSMLGAWKSKAVKKFFTGSATATSPGLQS